MTAPSPPPPRADASRGGRDDGPGARVWKNAKLLLAYLRDPARKENPDGFLYTPKDASVGLRAASDTKEAFVHVRGAERADDVQIKLRADKIIARRAPGQGWQGVEIDPCGVRVLVGGVWVHVGPDGTVTREAEGSGTKTFVEGDGAVILLSEDAEVIVSPDGSDITRRTADRIEGLTPDGVVSRARRIAGAGR